MKKFLSLVLALVMTMSLVTVSAGAKDKYNDASKITYKEAVAVMSELGVIDGYTNGDFGPTATLTRGAAAKIICNLILGPTTAAALKADTAPFIDVPADHVFAGYIAYCAQQGIINGYADGTFRPSAGLTGYAFMKMLLGALGYESTVEGYVGANWSVQVAKQAIAIGLDDGNDNFNGLSIVTREEALLYAFNTMKATMVEYLAKTEVVTGNATVTISGGRQDVTNNRSDDYRGATDGDGKMQFCEKYFSKLSLNKGTDDFGRLTNEWKNGKKDIGTFVQTPDALYHADVNSKTIYADVDLLDNYAFDTFVDGDTHTGAQFEIAKKDKTKVSAAIGDEGLVGNGSDIYVYVNEDEDLDRIVVINTYLVKVVADYDSKKEVLDIDQLDDVRYPSDFNVSELSSDDWDGLDEYAEDDYMLITIANGEIKSIAKAEPVKATVTEYVHAESVTADGEEYKYSVASMQLTDTGDDYSYTLKDEYDLYLDEDGYVLFADGESADDKYVYIDEFSAHSTSNRAAADAYAYFIDGTEAEIKVSHLDGTKVNAGDVVSNTLNNRGAGWYTYTIKNEKYKLTYVEDQTGIDNEFEANDVVANYKLNHTKVFYGTDDNEYYDGNSKTNFIIVDKDGDVKVYTGIRNVPQIVAGDDTMVNVNFSSSYAQNVFVDLKDGKTKGASLSDDIIFLLDLEKQGNDADDDEYYRYKALKNGEETKVRIDKTVLDSDEGAGYLVMDVEYTGKNYITDGVQVTGTVAQNREDVSMETLTTGTADQKNSTLILDATDYFMADSYKIYVVSYTGAGAYDKWDTYTLKQLVRAADKGDIDLGGAAVYGILNADNEYTALYIKLA